MFHDKKFMFLFVIDIRLCFVLFFIIVILYVLLKANYETKLLPAASVSVKNLPGNLVDMMSEVTEDL